MTEVVFDIANGGPLENELRSNFMKLKKDNRPRWNDVLHDYAVMSSIYVDTFSATFKRDGKIETNVDVIIKDISINANAEWSTNGKLVIKGNKSPFGVRGFTIKRFM